MRRLMLVSVTLLLIAAFLLSAAPAMADKGSDPPSFTAMGIDCALLDPGTEELDAEGILHVRGLTFGGFIESDNELLAGTSVVVVNFDMNTATGVGPEWVVATFSPTAMAGTWVAPGRSVTVATAPVIHSGYGNGELAGMRIQFRAKPVRGYTGQSPCPGGAEPLNVLEFRGVILPVPGSH